MYQKASFHTKAIHGPEGAKEILEGIKKTTDVIISTLGAAGSNVTIDKGGRIVTTKDGAYVARHMVWPDTVSDMAKMIVVDATSRAERTAGDGTTTCACLLQALCMSLYDIVHVQNNNSYEVIRGVKKAVEDLTKAIDALSIPIVENSIIDSKKLANVATVSANNDTEIGNKIADVVETVGVEGAVIVEKVQGNGIEVEYVKGYSFDSGLIRREFANHQTGKLDITNALILLIDEEVKDLEAHLKNIMQAYKAKCHEDGIQYNLVLIASDVSGAALQTLVKTWVNQQFPCVAIKAAKFGLERHEIMEDLQAITGTPRIYGTFSGYPFTEFTKESSEFGIAARVISTIHKTTIFMDKSAAVMERISEQVEAVKIRQRDLTEDARINFYNERRAKLLSSMAYIRVGSQSDLAHEDTYQLVQDAQLACFSALDRGVIPGGGRGLDYAKRVLNAPEGTPAFRRGYIATLEAVSAPAKRILSNGGRSKKSADSIYDNLRTREGLWDGYNVLTDKYEDFYDTGIIDAAKVSISALEYAASSACELLTTNYFLAIQNEQVNGK